MHAILPSLYLFQVKKKVNTAYITTDLIHEKYATANSQHIKGI